jgi:acylaminoacyl-peptidase
MDTGESAAVSSLAHAPANLTWSPDGRSIAFNMAVAAAPVEPPPMVKPLDKPAGANWAKPFEVITRPRWRTNGVQLLPDTRTHIFVLPADGGTARQLTDGDYDHSGAVSWGADSKTLYFSANRRSDAWLHLTDSNLYALSLEDGAIVQLTDRVGPDGQPVVSPDGRTIAFVGHDDRGMTAHNTELYVMNIDGSGVRRVETGYDGSVSGPQWSPDGKRIFVNYFERGPLKLGSVPASGGQLREHATGLCGMGINRAFCMPPGFSLARDGTWVTAFGSPMRPADIGVATRRGGAPRMLTRLNEDVLGHLSLADYTEITWKSSYDGQDIHGWYVKPPGFDASKKYPFVLEIHGGPQMAWGPYFSPLVQVAAANGYVVLLPNPRGSTSYGAAFRDEIDHNYPSEDYDDLMSGVDAMIDLGFIDEDQLFITGLSGGGVLTTWSIGKTDRFAAAVARGPVINFTSEVLTATMNYPTFLQAFYGETPWENPEKYWHSSPLSLVGNVKTPTMLMTGDADYQTTISETEQYYSALKYEGVDTVFVRVPDAGHVFFRPSQMITELDYLFSWFERYAKE